MNDLGICFDVIGVLKEVGSRCSDRGAFAHATFVPSRVTKAQRKPEPSYPTLLILRADISRITHTATGCTQDYSYCESGIRVLRLHQERGGLCTRDGATATTVLMRTEVDGLEEAEEASQEVRTFPFVARIMRRA